MGRRFEQQVKIRNVFMEVRPASQTIVTETVLCAGNITDVKIRTVNAAAGKIIVEVRIRESGREQQVLLDPGFGEGMHVEQVVIRALAVSNSILHRLTGKLLDFEGIVQFSRL